MTTRNYQTLINVYLERGNDRGVVRVRKYGRGKYTLYTKKYNVATRVTTHRSLNEFTSKVEVVGWANKFIETAKKYGAIAIAR